VRTRFGWELIKVEAVQEPQVVSLEKARPEIARELAEEDAGKKVIAQRAQDILKKLRAGKTLAELFPTPDDAKEQKTKA